MPIPLAPQLKQDIPKESAIIGGKKVECARDEPKIRISDFILSVINLLTFVSPPCALALRYVHTLP